MTDLTWVQEEENELPEAVRELIREAHSENTRRAYQSDLRAFRKWGGDVPTNPHELARYIAEEGMHLHPSTVRRRLAALSVAHRLTGGHGHAFGRHGKAPVLSEVRDLNPQYRCRLRHRLDGCARARRINKGPYRESGLVLVP